jgi:hypothetical protein
MDKTRGTLHLRKKIEASRQRSFAGAHSGRQTFPCYTHDSVQIARHETTGTSNSELSFNEFLHAVRVRCPYHLSQVSAFFDKMSGLPPKAIRLTAMQTHSRLT